MVAVHHRGTSDEFTFNVTSVDHTTGILVSAPTEVAAGEDFDVQIEVLCITAGCNLMGKIIQVKDEDFNLKGEGKTTQSFYNLTYLKFGYRGWVKVTAPEEVGTYAWWGMFPYQSRHKAAMARFNVVKSGERVESRGFPDSRHV